MQNLLRGCHVMTQSTILQQCASVEPPLSAEKWLFTVISSCRVCDCLTDPTALFFLFAYLLISLGYFIEKYWIFSNLFRFVFSLFSSSVVWYTVWPTACDICLVCLVTFLPVMGHYIFIHSFIRPHCLSSMQFCRGLEPIPAVNGQEVGYIQTPTLTFTPPGIFTN